MLSTKEEYRCLKKKLRALKQDQRKMQTKIISRVKRRIHFLILVDNLDKAFMDKTHIDLHTNQVRSAVSNQD